MTCNEWINRVERYRMAVHAHSEAVDRLCGETGTAFNEAWYQAERARRNSDAARAAVLEHERAHACGVGKPSDGSIRVADLETEDLILGDQGQSGG